MTMPDGALLDRPLGGAAGVGDDEQDVRNLLAGRCASGISAGYLLAATVCVGPRSRGMTWSAADATKRAGPARWPCRNNRGSASGNRLIVRLSMVIVALASFSGSKQTHKEQPRHHAMTPS